MVPAEEIGLANGFRLVFQTSGERACRGGPWLLVILPIRGLLPEQRAIRRGWRPHPAVARKFLVAAKIPSN